MEVYRCRMCRARLFDEREVAHGATCSTLFVEEPLAWMRPGNKLACPKCGAKLGTSDWAGLRCSCGEWVVPGFGVARSRVDVTKARRRDEPVSSGLLQWLRTAPPPCVVVVVADDAAATRAKFDALWAGRFLKDGRAAWLFVDRAHRVDALVDEIVASGVPPAGVAVGGVGCSVEANKGAVGFALAPTPADDFVHDDKPLLVVANDTSWLQEEAPNVRVRKLARLDGGLSDAAVRTLVLWLNDVLPGHDRRS